MKLTPFNKRSCHLATCVFITECIHGHANQWLTQNGLAELENSRS